MSSPEKARCQRFVTPVVFPPSRGDRGRLLNSGGDVAVVVDLRPKESTRPLRSFAAVAAARRAVWTAVGGGEVLAIAHAAFAIDAS